MNKQIPVVGVLLATFNGEKFLEEQLESIFCQELVSICLHVNDDGSTDSTLSIIEKWINKGYRIHVEKSLKMGLPHVFFSLLNWSCHHDYFAFSDQDDVWQPNHLKRSLEVLDSGFEVTSGLRMLIDKDGKLKNQRWKFQETSGSFKNALVENIAFGNTMVFTDDFRKKALKFDWDEVVFHDSWFYLLGSFYNVYHLDTQIHVKYRLHDNNVTGISNRNVFRIINQQRNFKLQSLSLFRQLEGDERLSTNVDILTSHIRALNSTILRHRLVYAWKLSSFRKSRFAGLIVAFFVLFGQI